MTTPESISRAITPTDVLHRANDMFENNAEHVMVVDGVSCLLAARRGEKSAEFHTFMRSPGRISLDVESHFLTPNKHPNASNPDAACERLYMDDEGGVTHCQLPTGLTLPYIGSLDRVLWERMTPLRRSIQPKRKYEIGVAATMDVIVELMSEKYKHRPYSPVLRKLLLP